MTDDGAATFIFQKSIDLLHTLYVFSEMQTRRPSQADDAILIGYLEALSASLVNHPGHPLPARFVR